jgi:hypothetical protein
LFFGAVIFVPCPRTEAVKSSSVINETGKVWRDLYIMTSFPERDIGPTKEVPRFNLQAKFLCVIWNESLWQGLT